MTGPTPTPSLPVGTRVVLREPALDIRRQAIPGGAVGRVGGIEAGGSYLVLLADGRQAVLTRSVLAVHKLMLPLPAERDTTHLAEALVGDHTVLAVVFGSRAFGLAGPDSDRDVRGVYVAPTPWFWSLRKPPTHVEGPEPEHFSWEVERFCELALRANPNVLEVLHSPQVIRCSELGAELLELRAAFLSQLVYSTYNGYVLSQFKKIEADLRRHGEPRWKHVMHLLRLLLSCRQLLLSGRLDLDVGPFRDRLLAVRRGELGWDEVERWRLGLHAELDDALVRTPLPAGPDAHRVDGWLVSVRRRGACPPPRPT